MVPKKPVILITPALVQPYEGSSEHSLELRRNYADAISQLGGLPLVFGYDHTSIDQAIAHCDGVLISGSNPGEVVAKERLSIERKVTETALAVKRPILGICHGMQVIGQVLGGAVVDIEDDVAGAGSRHNPHRIPDQFAHDVELNMGSGLKTWLDATRLRVNSFHRHALIGPGDFVVAARSAEDQVIEAIEGLVSSFCLGVQWHPEFLLSSYDRRILVKFLEAAKGQA